MRNRQSRPGNTSVLVLGILSFLLGTAALAVQYLHKPFGKGMDAYDYSTAADTYRSELKAEIDMNFVAAFDYRRKTGEAEVRKKLNSYEIREEIEWKKTVILLVSYTDVKNRTRYEVVELTKLEGADYWQPDRDFRFDKLRTDKPEIAKKIDDWLAKNPKE